jgi:serine/threonine-protein kinase
VDDIGRYRILGELGSGAMGVVFRAYDPVLGREVAIKTLKLNELSTPSERDALRDRLAREARAAAALSHAGIVTIHDVVFEQHPQGDRISLVMERIEGQTLAQALAAHYPDLPTVLRIIRESAAALDYAHRKGIVHRDIKPANLMLDETGSVKIADFGIAKITTSETRTESASGLIVGTAGYMAPEQLRGDAVDGKADQFALAVVAYEMLAHRRPFVADSLIALTHQVVFQDPPTLSELRRGFGPGVDMVLRKALAKRPEDRYPTCSALAADLESQVHAAVSEPTQIFVPYPPPATIRTKKPSRWPLVLAILFVVLSAAGVVAEWFFLHRAPEPQPRPVLSASAPAAAPEPKVEEPVKLIPPPSKTAPVKAPAVSSIPLEAGTVRINKKDAQKYVWIPSGTFTMGCVGSDRDCRDYEKPPHRVTVSKGFWMAQTEATVAAYKSAIRVLPKPPSFDANWTLTDHPMVDVTWVEASSYCASAGGRLPTEAEWEYAARGGVEDTIFPWGNRPSHELANFGEGTNRDDEKGAVEGRDQWMNTSPVASFPANKFGLFDMIGNVSEWCADWYSPTYYSHSPAIDPQGPGSGTTRAVRGGSWKSPPKFMRAGYRWNRPPDERGWTSGFRCVVNTLP